jgi:hypothetical protein
LKHAVSAAPDPEAAYYQAVEDFFVSRRGDPLFLSSADWTLIHRWRKAGLPLRVVLRGIADALDGHAHSWGRERKVGSLRYCEAEVEAARDRWERALALGSDEAGDVAGVLRGFAAALREATGLGPEGRRLAAAISEELQGREAEAEPRARDLEPWLAAQEGRLLAAVRSEGGSAVVAEAEAEVDKSLEPYRGRMPDRVLKQLRADGVARRLLARHGLPRLSLFLT